MAAVGCGFQNCSPECDFTEDCAARFVPCWDCLVGYLNDNTIQCLRITTAVTDILTESTFIPCLLSQFATIVNFCYNIILLNIVLNITLSILEKMIDFNG